MSNNTTLEAIVAYRLSSYITAPVVSRPARRNNASPVGFFPTYDAAIRSGAALLNQDGSIEGRGVGVAMSCYRSALGTYVSALPQLCDRADEARDPDEDLSFWLEQANTESPAAFAPPVPVEAADGYADDAEDANVQDGFAGYQLELAAQRLNGRRVVIGSAQRRIGYFTPNCVSQAAVSASIGDIDSWRNAAGSESRRNLAESRWLAQPIRQIGPAINAATAPNSGSCVVPTRRQRRLVACW